MSSQFKRVMKALAEGTPAQLEELSVEIPGFPDGVDDFIQRRWIINAIDEGSKEAITWILGKGVNLDFRDEEGYTPLHAALERKLPDKYECLEHLLRSGAPVNRKGINDWTPAHMAAARDDVDALKVLIRYRADLSIRTEIDHYTTPLQEARNLGSLNAAKYLENAV